MQIFGRTEVTKTKWCIYDIKDDAIIVEGTIHQMEEILDTMAGNLMITTVENVNNYRIKNHRKNKLQ